MLLGFLTIFAYSFVVFHVAATQPASMSQGHLRDGVAVVRSGRRGPGIIPASATVQAEGSPGAVATTSRQTTIRWVTEEMVHVGPVKIGIPSLISLIMYINPLLEVVPRLFRERTVHRLPLLPYSAMFMAGVIWTTYGILVESANLVVANVLSVILSIIYICSFLWFCPREADWLPFTPNVHILAMMATMLFCYLAIKLAPISQAISLLGFAGCTLASVMFAGPLAAVRTVIQEKDTRSLPLGFTVIVTANCATWLFYALFVRYDPMVLFPNPFGLMFGLAQLCLFAVYGIDSSGQGKMAGKKECSRSDRKVSKAI